jgi:FkbM family methyltransferase
MNTYYNNCILYDENDYLLNDFSRNVENGSRILIEQYVKHDMKVLEMGAKYGSVSVCLDYILTDPKNQLVCVDPDISIKNCLEKNRQINNCTFNIFNGAISKKDLYVVYNNCIWETKTYIDPPKHLKYIKCVTLSIDELQKLYNITFDCLIADCEGFLLEFIKENPDFFDNLKCIIYEEDCTSNNPINNVFIDYNEVEQFLINKGFILINTFKDHIGLNNKVWLK